MTFTWTDYIYLFRSQKYWMDKVITELGITSQMALALREIPETGSVSMKTLSAELVCDASNVTGIIDRLEARGLVTRRADANDRRVKCVILTPAGRRLRKRIDEALDQAPPAVAAMSLADQHELGMLIRQALANADAERLERVGS